MSECQALKEMKGWGPPGISQEHMGARAIAGTWSIGRISLTAGALIWVGQPREHCVLGSREQPVGGKCLRRSGRWGVTSKIWG